MQKDDDSDDAHSRQEEEDSKLPAVSTTSDNQPSSNEQQDDDEAEAAVADEEEERRRQEFIRARNAQYSRRKYKRKKIEVEVLHQQCSDLQIQNKKFRDDNKLLEELYASAQQIVSHLDANPGLALGFAAPLGMLNAAGGYSVLGVQPTVASLLAASQGSAPSALGGLGSSLGAQNPFQASQPSLLGDNPTLESLIARVPRGREIAEASARAALLASLSAQQRSAGLLSPDTIAQYQLEQLQQEFQRHTLELRMAGLMGSTSQAQPGSGTLLGAAGALNQSSLLEQLLLNQSLSQSQQLAQGSLLAGAVAGLPSRSALDQLSSASLADPLPGSSSGVGLGASVQQQPNVGGQPTLHVVSDPSTSRHSSSFQESQRQRSGSSMDANAPASTMKPPPGEGSK